MFAEVERTSSAAETEALGERIAAALGPGDVVLVSGELGAGKTTLIRGAARALGVTDRVTSPTFTIGNRYRGRVPVSHLDLYRLEGLDREDPALLDDYLDQDSVVLIEWPERGEGAPQMRGRSEGEAEERPVSGGMSHPIHVGALDRVAARVMIRHAGGDERQVEIVRRAST
jgi:tRNA threonylcarbamoyladenosine biosynthesis protein TsaE